MSVPSRFCRIFSIALAACSGPALAGLPLETETTNLQLRGHGEAEAAYEFQTGSNGDESAVPLVLEYGILDSLQFTLEPVVYTSIQPDSGRHASGIGDTEASLTYRLSQETHWLPAFAVAGEIKFPTARDTLIGTKETDYRIFGIASKNFGAWSTHVNLGYTFVGDPPGTTLGNIFDYAFAAEYRINTRFEVVAEIIGNAASGGSESSSVTPGAASVVPEAAGNETIFLGGVRYAIARDFTLSLGVGYSSTKAVLFRPGISYFFH